MTKLTRQLIKERNDMAAQQRRLSQKGQPALQQDWENFCEGALDHKHKPDLATLHIEYDGDGAYIDINCSLCGRSGCAGKFDPAKIDW